MSAATRTLASAHSLHSTSKPRLARECGEWTTSQASLAANRWQRVGRQQHFFRPRCSPRRGSLARVGRNCVRRGSASLERERRGARFRATKRLKGVRNFASGTSESLREDLLRVPAESKISASVAKVLSEEVLSFRTEASGASVREAQDPVYRFVWRPNVGEWGRVEARNMAHAGCFQEEKG